MASTIKSATPIRIKGDALSSDGRMDWFRGIEALSSGTVELKTGLSVIAGIWFTCLDDTATETVVFRVHEDLPTSTGTITVSGIKIDHNETTAADMIVAATSENFCWFAIGAA